jgi:hypothetical protein
MAATEGMMDMPGMIDPAKHAQDGQEGGSK